MDRKNIEIIQDLIKYKSVQSRPDEMSACLEYCKDLFAEYEVTAKEYEKNGSRSIVISNTDSLHFDVILLGHIDTVEGPDNLFLGEQKEGKLFGRGSMDMKAFVATSILTMQKILDENTSSHVALMIVTDEELGGINGAKYLVEEVGYTARVVLVPDDGERIDQVVSHSKSLLFVKFRATGIEAHGNRPWDGRSAIDMLIETKQKLEENFPSTKGLAGTQWIETMNVGKILGGSAVNEVSGHAEMDVDIRFTEKYTKADMLEWVENAAIDGVEFSEEMYSPGTSLDMNDADVQRYLEVVGEHVGTSPHFLKSGGGTDGRYFYANGMTVIAHQGSGGGTQGDGEFVEVSSLQKLIDIQSSFILTMQYL